MEEENKEIIQDEDENIIENVTPAEVKEEETEILDTSDTQSSVVIKNKSTFSKEGYIEMNKEVAKKSYSLMIAMELILVAIDVFLFIQQQWLYGAVVAAFIVLYPFLIKWMAKGQLNKTFKMYSNVFDNSLYDFTFLDKQMNVLLKTKEAEKRSIIPYNKLYMAIENDDYIFIFITAIQSYIVEKKGFENPTDAEVVIETFKKAGLKCKRTKSPKKK